MRLVLCMFLLATIVVSGVSAEWNWREAGPQPFEAPEDKDYVVAVGRDKDNLQTVNASDIVDALGKGKEIRLRYAKIEGDVRFHGVARSDAYFIQSTFWGEAEFSYAKFSGEADFWLAKFLGEADFGNAEFSGEAKFSNAEFSREADYGYAKFLGEADFSNAKFSEREADFSNTEFSGEAKFSNARFSGEADFSNAELSGEAKFSDARFSGEAKFSDARFPRDAYFSYAKFSGDADFSNAKFSGEAYFSYAKFSEREADFSNTEFSGEAYFFGAEFSGEAYFSYAKFSRKAHFDEAKLLGGTVFDRTTFEGNARFSHTRFFRDLYLNLAEFEKSGSLSLENSVYPNIYVNLPDDPSELAGLLNNPSEDTYLRLLKNQKGLGRPYKSLYVAMKRYQRAQKFPPVRWLEWCLFDFPTQYGTASFPPKGMLIYIAVVLVVFTASYYGINVHMRRSRGVEILEYHNTNGGEAKRQRKMGAIDIFWFSLNTFIPAVHFVNMQNWRIRDDRFLKIKCSTLATVESILGWLLIPILLRYFRL